MAAKKESQVEVENKLPLELQDKYEIVGKYKLLDKFNVVGLEIGYIQWSSMTEKFAETLIAKNFPGIKRKITVPQ